MTDELTGMMATVSLVVLEGRPWPAHLMKVLASALNDKVLAMALREKSWPCPCRGQGQDFSPKTHHIVAVRVCSAHTHGVT